jgi:hypothetical protein
MRKAWPSGMRFEDAARTEPVTSRMGLPLPAPALPNLYPSTGQLALQSELAEMDEPGGGGEP